MNEKHHSRETTKSGWLLPILLLFSVLSYAQNESTADSTVLTPSIDSIATIADKEATFQEDDTAVEDEEVSGEKKAQYFLRKSRPGSGLDSFKPRKADDRLLRNNDDFWYANTVFKKKKEKESSFQGSVLYQTVLWLLAVGAFIAFLIIYLSNSNVSLFRRSNTINDAESDVETDDIFAIQYQKEIDKAITAGNYRLAVRLLFLQQLRSLSDRHIIQYTQDRTNFDYLLQVHHAPWYQHFFRLTRNYEYVWYGQFDIDKPKFDIINNDFISFQRQLPQI